MVVLEEPHRRSSLSPRSAVGGDDLDQQQLFWEKYLEQLLVAPGVAVPVIAGVLPYDLGEVPM
jgi:hypothetical protein